MRESFKNWVKQGIRLHAGNVLELDKFYFSVAVSRFSFEEWNEVREFYFAVRGEIIRKYENSKLKLINQLNS